MIFCDYGALSTNDRQVILNKIYHHLKPSGKLLFDVFTMKSFSQFKEQQTWGVCHKDGFWRVDEYVKMNGYYKWL